MFLKWFVTLVLGLAIVFSVGNGSSAASNSICNKNQEKEHQVLGPVSIKTPDIVNVHLKTIYIDGVTIINIVDDHFISSENVFTKYSGWSVTKCNEKDVFLSKKMDDLSPISKAVGIFGLKDGNVLTLYKGDPKERQIIQTFFQIDVNALEADRVKQLKEGIRVSNKNQYKELLHTLSRFALKTTSEIETKS